MRSDKAEFELLLATARILRAHLRELPNTGEDVMCLSEALKPFDPLPGHGGDFVAVDPLASARGLAQMIRDYGVENPLVKQKLAELSP